MQPCDEVDAQIERTLVALELARTAEAEAARLAAATAEAEAEEAEAESLASVAAEAAAAAKAKAAAKAEAAKSMESAGLRFGVGERVSCHVGDGWKEGTVILHWYREESWCVPPAPSLRSVHLRPPPPSLRATRRPAPCASSTAGLAWAGLSPRLRAPAQVCGEARALPGEASFRRLPSPPPPPPRGEIHKEFHDMQLRHSPSALTSTKKKRIANGGAVQTNGTALTMPRRGIAWHLQVRLDSGSKIYAPEDDDHCIRAAPPRAVGKKGKAKGKSKGKPKPKPKPKPSPAPRSEPAPAAPEGAEAEAEAEAEAASSSAGSAAGGLGSQGGGAPVLYAPGLGMGAPMSVAQLRSAGNECFARKEWYRAVGHYSSAIDLLQAKPGEAAAEAEAEAEAEQAEAEAAKAGQLFPCGAAGSRLQAAGSKLLALLLSNRAAALQSAGSSTSSPPYHTVWQPPPRSLPSPLVGSSPPYHTVWQPPPRSLPSPLVGSRRRLEVRLSRPVSRISRRAGGEQSVS